MRPVQYSTVIRVQLSLTGFHVSKYTGMCVNFIHLTVTPRICDLSTAAWG